MDGISFVRKIDAKPESVFIYLDPPYFQKGADLYMNFYVESDHRRLANFVHKMKKRWMISYDHHEFILSLYAGERKILYRLSQSASNRVGNEVLVFSEALRYTQSMTELNSALHL